MTSTLKTFCRLKIVVVSLIVVSFCFIEACYAADFSGSLKGVSITDLSDSNQPPTAVINYTQNGDAFTFDASGSTDVDGSVVDYKWDFGDGMTGTGISVSHIYANITSASVSLTVVDNSKGVTISQQQISICESQSADVSYVATSRFTPDIYSDVVYGQSFTPNTTGAIYSIKVTPYFIPDPSTATLMIRIGDTPDLSTNYDVEEIISLANYTGGDTIEIIFATKPTITVSVTKYFMIYNTGGYATRFKLNYNSISGYTGGVAYTSTTGLANVVANAGDLNFEVMICD